MRFKSYTFKTNTPTACSVINCTGYKKSSIHISNHAKRPSRKKTDEDEVILLS